MRTNGQTDRHTSRRDGSNSRFSQFFRTHLKDFTLFFQRRSKRSQYILTFFVVIRQEMPEKKKGKHFEIKIFITWWALQMRSKSCCCKNRVTISSPNVKDTPRSLLPHNFASWRWARTTSYHNIRNRLWRNKTNMIELWDLIRSYWLVGLVLHSSTLEGH